LTFLGLVWPSYLGGAETWLLLGRSSVAVQARLSFAYLKFYPQGMLGLNLD